MNGLECLDRIMVERPCPVVMVSSLTAEGADATLEALRLGAVDFVPKPDGAVSLRMDELRADVGREDSRSGHREAEKQRAAEGARAAAHAGPRPRRVPAASSWASRGARIGRRSGARRHLDRRPAGARSLAGAVAREFPVAHPRRATHAGELHGAARQTARRICAPPRGRGVAPDGLGSRLRLYRSRRCRSHRGPRAPPGWSR